MTDFFDKNDKNSEEVFNPNENLASTVDQYLIYQKSEVGDIAPLVLKLSKANPSEEVDSRVIKFFEVYD